MAPQFEPQIAGRRAALLFLVSGLLAFLGVVINQVPAGRATPIVALAILDLVLAGAFYALPWHRFPRRALLAILAVGYITIGLFDIAGAFPTPYLYPLFFILLSVWLGLSQPPRTALWLTPITAAAYVWPLLQPGHDGRAPSSVITAVVTFVLVSEVIARAVNQIESYASHPRAIPALVQAGFRVVAGAPIVIERKIAAVMVAAARRPIQLTEQDLEALELLAQQAAAGLANAIRFERQGREQESLREAALRDHLTGLGNRQFVTQILADLRPNDGLLLADLDHFKSVNDSDGHAAGDAVIVALAGFFKTTLRSHDRAARYGGEEFLLVLPQVGGAALDVARRLVQGWQSTNPRTTISIGAAVHQAGRSSQATMQAADAALYAAKHQGRNCARAEATSENPIVSVPVPGSEQRARE